MTGKVLGGLGGEGKEGKWFLALTAHYKELPRELQKYILITRPHPRPITPDLSRWGPGD